jgi:Ca-activated chloride channel family protein
VRIEEMINYFKYNYPQPKNNQPFSINTEYNDSPWNSKHKLLKIGLQGKDVPMDKLANSNFVFLIDVSGSMNAANKLPLLKSSFKVLLEQLRPQDKVGIVVYAGSAGMILPPTSAKEKNKILNTLDNLQAGGSTAGGAGIELAYKLAQENFIKGGNNRVIIATDGDFNVGTSSTGDLQTLIEEKRKSGVFLTCLGFGMGNFKDNRMETLANKGNGNYAYIDNLQEANKFLGKEFAGSMYAIAKDVKIQIEFNPKFVKSYRLIGYENRKLKNEDFTNDKIDAGELGSGHTVTALYEVIPADVKSEFLPKESDLKYTKNTNDENFSDELATIKFRYKNPDGDTSSEIVQVVKNSNENLSSASDDFKFASSVAWFGLVLRNSDLIKNKDLIDVEKLGKKGRGNDDEGYRAEFVRLVEAYRNLNK